MSKFNIGDVVRFVEAKKELAEKEFVISHISRVGEKEEEICLEGFEMYFFAPSQFELVRRCPYKTGDRISVSAVYWNQEKNRFVIDEVMGTVVEDGCIDFDERTMDCFHVPITKLGIFWGNEENGNDYDVVFCLSTEEEIRKAKKIWFNVMERKVKELKEELKEVKSSCEELKAQIM